MSFNVRYAEPSDGLDIWEKRRPIAARMLELYRPDVIGMQEPEIEQLTDMESDLPWLKRFGKSRYGNDFEKFSAVFYNPSTLELMDEGAYWISENPDEPGSMAWLIHKPYAITWGRFRHLGTGHEFEVHNSQFPYKAEQAEARHMGAQIIRQRAQFESTILTGDFNCDASGVVHGELKEDFQDTFEQISDRIGPSATFHGFTGEPTHPARLDWIMYRGHLTPKSYETITYNEGDRYPSDHYPVVAEFEWETS